MKVLGVDPGSAETGLCLLVDEKPQTWGRSIREDGESLHHYANAVANRVLALADGH